MAADDPIFSVAAGGTGTDRGSGGMASKLAAARIASWSGVRAVIANAARPNVLADGLAAVPGFGTTFAPHDRRLPARKLWIAFASGSDGTIAVDDGARRALVERGVSLLPAGVRGVAGDFDAGDPVDVATPDGRVFARGIAAIDTATLRAVAGRRTRGPAARGAPRGHPPRRPRGAALLSDRSGRRGARRRGPAGWRSSG